MERKLCNIAFPLSLVLEYLRKCVCKKKFSKINTEGKNCGIFLKRGLGLILMRIRFRASDFGQVAKNNCHSCKIETGVLCGDGARVIYFFAHVIQQLGFRTKKIQANVDYCYVRRRAECTSLGPGLKRPSLRSLTLVWPRRDVPRRFT